MGLKLPNNSFVASRGDMPHPNSLSFTVSVNESSVQTHVYVKARFIYN